MKKSFSRLLAVALAVALVVTCAISGLILPVSAEETQSAVTDADLNLLSQDYPFTLEYGQTMSGGGRTYTLSETLATGEKLLLRFEAKGAPITASCTAGTWGRTETTVASDEWHVYQQSFPVLESYNDKNTAWVSWTPDWSNAAEGDTIEVRNVRIYKVTSALNLIHDGDMDNGSFTLFNGKTAGEGQVLGITEDPSDPNNNVFQFANISPYWSLGSVYSDPTYDGSKIYKIRMRIRGSLRFTLGYGFTLLNNAGARSESANKEHTYYSSQYGWTTIEFFTCPTNSAFPSWLQFCSVDTSGASKDLWIDDVEMYEVGRAESWTIDETVDLEPLSDLVSLNNFIKTTPVNSYPFGDNNANPFAWTLQEGTGNNAAGIACVTLAASAYGRLQLTQDGKSLATVRPVLTVTDGTTSKTVNVNWAYAPQPIVNATFNDVVGDMHVWTTQWNTNTWVSTAGKGMDGSAAGYATASTGTVYYNKPMYMKPNTKYRFSMLAKATEGNIRVSLENYTNCTVSSAITYTGDGKWHRLIGYIVTNDEPGSSTNSGINIAFTADSTATAPEAIIDNIVLEEINSITEPILDGDFDIVSEFGTGWGANLSFVDASQEEGGNIGGNATTVLKVPAGTASTTSAAVPQTYLHPTRNTAMLKAGQAYKISFKHYGGAATFSIATSMDDTVRGGGGSVKCAESTEWKEYSINYVPGADSNSGNDPYRMRFYAPDATTDAYIDDFKVEIIKNTVYVALPSTLLGNSSGPNIWMSGTDSVNGKVYSGQLFVSEMSVGTKLYFDFTPTTSQLPVPGSLKVHYADGSTVTVLNTAHDSMTGSAGNRFGPIEVKEGVGYITFNFANVSTGYQWGTIATSVRRVKVDNVSTITGMRFLNRLYINGLDWSADELKVTVDGVEYTITELGAIARKKDGNDLSLGSYERRGVCYEYGDTTISVTDYTQRYLDFTVVLPFANVTSDATEYQCRAYMELTPAEGEAIIVYTDTMTDSLDAALRRGA